MAAKRKDETAEEVVEEVVAEVGEYLPEAEEPVTVGEPEPVIPEPVARPTMAKGEYYSKLLGGK